MAGKNRKRLRLSPDDRVVGMQPRQKRDLYAGCNEPGKEWFHPDAHVFEKTFCRLCKNADCIRAKGSVSPWHTRMAEQVDYLLNDPEFSDLTSEPHQKIANQMFEDMGRQAMRLEIARQKQDWEIPPDEGPTDGFDKVASPDTTDQFDEAVKKLAKARGKGEPDLPRPQGENAPAHFQNPVEEASPQAPVDEDENPYEYETQFPSTDGTRRYHVAIDKGNKWTCECDGFRYAAKCKHIDTVRAWYEENQEEESAPVPPPVTPQTAPPQAPRPKTPPPPRDPRLPPEQEPLNTPMPQGGVMLGGDPSDPRGPQTRQPAKDPWAIPKETVVEPGARVTVKSPKKTP